MDLHIDTSIEPETLVLSFPRSCLKVETTDHHPIQEASVVVGLGSIGQALAPSLAGSHFQVVFFGRRHPDKL